MKLGRMVDAPDSCAAVQRDLKRLEKWAPRNLVSSKKVKYQVLFLRNLSL